MQITTRCVGTFPLAGGGGETGGQCLRKDVKLELRCHRLLEGAKPQEAGREAGNVNVKVLFTDGRREEPKTVLDQLKNVLLDKSTTHIKPVGNPSWVAFLLLNPQDFVGTRAAFSWEPKKWTLYSSSYFTVSTHGLAERRKTRFSLRLGLPNAWEWARLMSSPDVDKRTDKNLAR